MKLNKKTNKKIEKINYPFIGIRNCYSCKKSLINEYLTEQIKINNTIKELCFNCSAKKQKKARNTILRRLKRFWERVGMKASYKKEHWVIMWTEEENPKKVFNNDKKTKCFKCKKLFIDIYCNGIDTATAREGFNKDNGDEIRDNITNLLTIKLMKEKRIIAYPFWRTYDEYHYYLLCDPCYVELKIEFNRQRIMIILTFFIAIGSIASIITAIK